MALDVGVENRFCIRLFNSSAKGGSNCAWRRRCFQKLGDRRNYISVASAGVEQRPTPSPVNADHLSNCSHTGTTLDTLRLTGQADRESGGVDRPTLELTGRGDYIQHSFQSIKLRNTLPALRSNDLLN